MEIHRNLLHQRITLYLLIAIAFGLPVLQHVKYNGMTSLIILLTLNWVIEGNYKEKFNTLIKHKWTFALIPLYIVYLLGYIYTQNVHQANAELLLKLPLLLYPVILGSITYLSGKNIRTILHAFLIGCLLGVLVSLFNAIFYSNETINYFIYPKLSVILHPTLFSMYLNFAIFIILYNLYYKWNELSNIWRVLYFLTSVFFIIFIFLMLSRSGMLILMFMILAVGLYFTFHKRHFYKGIFGLILMGGLSFLMLDQIPHGTKRILSVKNEFFKAGSKNRSSRYNLWKASFTLIKEHPLIGVGTGDVKNELIKTYERSNMMFVANKKLNPHNQFLQITIATGIIGLLSIFAAMFLPLYISFVKKNHLLVLFLLVCILTFMIESVLELQAGVTFFAFFNSFLLFQIKDR